MPRIGAEYHQPNDEGSNVVTTARLVFLNRIEDVAPEVVDHLRENVLPAYRGAYENGTARPGRAWEHDALASWAEAYNLTDEWLLDDALHTLHFWVRWPRALEVAPGRFHAGGAGSIVPELDAPELQLHPWEPTSETWASYQSQARETFESWLREYRAAGGAWADALGLEAAPTVNAPRKTNDPGMHFEWLVRFQCQSWGHREIAEHYGRAYDEAKQSSPTVGRALREKARLIGLTRRTE